MVNPKAEKTACAAFDGTIGPKALTYKLKAKKKRRIRWKLKCYPRWLVPETRSGGAKRNRKKKLRFALKASKIGKLDPGIYTTTVKFTYGPRKRRKTVRRDVTLIVEGDPAAGSDLFVSKCSGCHDLYQNGSGPYLHNVYGRVAETAGGFSYS